MNITPEAEARAAGLTAALPASPGRPTGPNTARAYQRFWDNLDCTEIAVHRTPYLTIIVLAIFLGIAFEVLIITNRGANPFADMSRLIVGSIMWVILIMIALFLFFFVYTRMSDR
jgi:hypothetical protein